jgi:hypothetical protein
LSSGGSKDPRAVEDSGMNHAPTQHQTSVLRLWEFLGEILEQFLVIVTEQIKLVFIDTLHFVSPPCFRPTSNMDLSVVLLDMLRVD